MAKSSDTKHSSHPGMVAHFDPMQIPGSSKNHAASTSPTIAQVLRGREASKLMSNGSASCRNDHHHDMEHDHGSPHKRSVIAKVKEKARRWRHSLSRKKRSGDNLTHSDPGPDSLTVPDHSQNSSRGYGSTPVPGALREFTIQQPQAFSSNVNFVAEHKHPISSKSEPAMIPDSLSNPATVKAAQATISEPTNATTSKLQSHADSATTEERNNIGKDLAMTEKSITTPDAIEAVASQTAAASVSSSGSSLSKAGEQKWDKGVSVREYLMHKLEPGEDERVLSQVISEAMTPRTTGSHDPGVVRRVRDVVHSFLRSDQNSTKPVNDYHHSAGNSSENIPISTNSHEVVEQSPERILQAN